MDYRIEIDVWNLGYDEADELVAALSDFLVERGLGVALRADGKDEEVRSLVILRALGLVDVSTKKRLKKVMGPRIEGARRVTIPGANFTRTSG